MIKDLIPGTLFYLSGIVMAIAGILETPRSGELMAFLIILWGLFGLYQTWRTGDE